MGASLGSSFCCVLFPLHYSPDSFHPEAFWLLESPDPVPLRKSYNSHNIC